MDVAQQALDLAQLDACGSENLRRARKVIYYGNGEDLDAHLGLDLSSRFLVLVNLVEARDRVVILVGQLPPLRA